MRGPILAVATPLRGRGARVDGRRALLPSAPSPQNGSNRTKIPSEPLSMNEIHCKMYGATVYEISRLVLSKSLEGAARMRWEATPRPFTEFLQNALSYATVYAASRLRAPHTFCERGKPLWSPRIKGLAPRATDPGRRVGPSCAASWRCCACSSSRRSLPWLGRTAGRSSSKRGP